MFLGFLNFCMTIFCSFEGFVSELKIRIRIRQNNSDQGGSGSVMLLLVSFSLSQPQTTWGFQVPGSGRAAAPTPPRDTSLPGKGSHLKNIAIGVYS